MMETLRRSISTSEKIMIGLIQAELYIQMNVAFTFLLLAERIG